MNHIEWLNKHGACSSGVDFARNYPTLQAAWDASTSLADLRWVAYAPIRDAYEAALASIDAAYWAALAPSLAAYEAAYAPIRDAYWAALAPIRAAYLAACAPIYDTYDAALDLPEGERCDYFRSQVACPEIKP